jgi:pimeloyl-ACP methyl ester carboxylesterase
LTATRTIDVQPDLPIRLSEAGSGSAALILHGGGGPATVEPIATHLADTHRTLTPTHPGWNGSARPAWLTRIADLAAAYLNLLGELDLADILVIGSSIGGWIAAEMALQDGHERVGRLVLIDSVGVDIPGQPIRDFFALDARGVADYSYHDGDRFYVDPTALPAEQLSLRQANMATMRVLAGDPYMHDPSLLGRLGGVSIPTLVLWGERRPDRRAGLRPRTGRRDPGRPLRDRPGGGTSTPDRAARSDLRRDRRLPRFRRFPKPSF